MPYQAGKNLPGEKASKLGHLDVLRSPLVQQLVESFERPSSDERTDKASWVPFPATGQPLDLIFSVDGSIQVIEDELPPHKALAFVKTALMRIDQVALSRIDKDFPHPFEVRDLMTDSAMYHATVFPLRHVRVPEMSVYDAVRKTIYESLKDESLNGEPLETLKWIAYEKWSGSQKSLPAFQCPHCESDQATLPYDSERDVCVDCGGELFISDMLGFHLEMSEDAASDSVATAYMNIHETLLLFTGIRHFWETSRETLKRCLFLKDGPLQIRAQYSKLVAPIRRFLLHALTQNVPIHIVGQEKTGTFVEHLNLIGRQVPASHLFVPDHVYICGEVQHRPVGGALYGKDTNYGAKVFAVLTDRHRLVLNLPVSDSMADFIQAPSLETLIGLEQILTTLPQL
ncbi:MAG TPA: hypothetical protein PLQ88_05820, partial [Blastocatellia bacterium]|nr:hypothetical protein [Blastocatellia bacterium]